MVISHLFYFFFGILSIVIGPDMLLRKASNLGGNRKLDAYFDAGDAVEAHEWKCVRTINGRFLFQNFHHLNSFVLFP